MLNAYPYNPGHVMVIPYKHTYRIDKMTRDEANEHFELVVKCTLVLERSMVPEGFNTGMNLGRVAGAGIEEHVHTHVVPRWNGDTNFMPVVGDIRVMPQALAETYNLLEPYFRTIGSSL